MIKQIKLQIISFTLEGDALAQKLKREMRQQNCDVHTYSVKREASQSEYIQELKGWTGEQFQCHNALLFIGACGIAVRMISPYVQDKLTDSPVLVMDEAGCFVIPVLSGHVGGANALAFQIAELSGAVPVITTATDVRGCFSIDLFSQNNSLDIYNREGIARVSAKILEKKKVTLSIAKEYESQVDVRITASPNDKQALLTLVPREYIVGIGCRSGKEAEELREYADAVLAEAGLGWNQVRAVATIDQKKHEAAIVQLSQKKNLPLYTFSADVLEAVQGSCSPSDFVKQQVGVDNVCERAALACCKDSGILVVSKRVYKGVTIAVAKEDWRLTLYEE